MQQNNSIQFGHAKASSRTGCSFSIILDDHEVNYATKSLNSNWTCKGFKQHRLLVSIILDDPRRKLCNKITQFNLDKQSLQAAPAARFQSYCAWQSSSVPQSGSGIPSRLSLSLSLDQQMLDQWCGCNHSNSYAT